MTGEKRLKTLPELIVMPVAAGAFVAGNPFVRRWAACDAAFVELLGALAGDGATASELADRFAERDFGARDASESPYADGLLGDPTGLDRSAEPDLAAPLDIEQALKLATRLALVTADEDRYRESLARREHVLDTGRHGDIHQRVGEYVARRLRRGDLDTWWADQKFTEDRSGARDGPYRFVQWEFMAGRFPEGSLDGKRVLDFGCGPGLFSRLFARAGATVVGLDTNSDHLETAAALAERDGVGGRTTFAELRLPAEEGLAVLGDERFDLVFLSDVMMFYFHPYDRSVELDPVSLLRGLGERLTGTGRIVILEPNGTFWQQPWLGDPERPFTVLTEYRHRWHGVTPTLEQLSRAAEAAGLCITKVREPATGSTGSGGDRRARAFAAEFPLWWYFELAQSP